MDNCPHVICTCLQEHLDSLRRDLEEAVGLLILSAKQTTIEDGFDPELPSNTYAGKPIWYEYLSPTGRDFFDRHPQYLRG